jgi:hypothetical protein
MTLNVPPVVTPAGTALEVVAEVTAVVWEVVLEGCVGFEVVEVVVNVVEEVDPPQLVNTIMLQIRRIPRIAIRLCFLIVLSTSP